MLFGSGRGVLRRLLQVATDQGFAISAISTGAISASAGSHTGPTGAPTGDANDGARMVEVTMHVHGRGPVNNLAATLSEMDEVDAVVASDVNSVSE